MAEFLSFLDFFRPFFNTPAKFSLVQTKQMFLRFSAQFHGQIVVPDIQAPHVDIVVQRLCANHLIPGKVSRYKSIAHADIKEPPCGKELLFHRLDEGLLILGSCNDGRRPSCSLRRSSASWRIYIAFWCRYKAVWIRT